MHRDKGLSCIERIIIEGHHSPCPQCPCIQIDFGELDLQFFRSPPEGVSFCPSSCIQSAFCPARVVLCLAAIPRYAASASCTYQNQSASLLWTPGLNHQRGAWPGPRGAFTLKHQFTCPIMTDWLRACYILSLSHLSTCSFTRLFISHILSLSLLLHPFCLCPWGVSFTLYMPRQLHSSPLVHRSIATD